MYIKILLTIITVCQIYAFVKNIFFYRAWSKLVKQMNEVMPKVISGISHFFPGVSDENIKPFQN